MSITFFGDGLSSREYLEALQHDLNRQGAIVRFLVAYVCKSGIDAIGARNLANALQHPASFGLASLCCACSHHALVDLANLLSADNPSVKKRLAYFVDPRPDDPERKEDPALLHSKVVLVCDPRSETTVLYVGSHNWSGAALEPTATPRNVEASMRLELQFQPGHLDGTADDPAGKAARHLNQCWSFPNTFSVEPAHIETFERFHALACQQAAREPQVPLSEAVLCFAVQRSGARKTPADWAQWWHRVGASPLPGGIYAPASGLDEKAIEDAPLGEIIAIAIWQTSRAFKKSHKPIIVIGRKSTAHNVRGNNQVANVTKVFAAVVCNLPRLQNPRTNRDTQQVRRDDAVLSLLQAVCIEEENRTEATGAGFLMDHHVRQPPIHECFIDIERILIPSDIVMAGECEETGRVRYYSDGDVAISVQRPSVEKPGYWVGASREGSIQRMLNTVFGVTADADVLVKPIDETRKHLFGKRVTSDKKTRFFARRVNVEHANALGKGHVVPDMSAFEGNVRGIVPCALRVHTTGWWIEIP